MMNDRLKIAIDDVICNLRLVAQKKKHYFCDCPGWANCKHDDYLVNIGALDRLEASIMKLAGIENETA